MDNFFQQIDGVVMGSLLGPVLANIFMVHLETSLVPVLSEKMSLWLCYVDDTFTFIKEEGINDVINVLNAFHPNIKFTRGKEENKCISFLDVNIIKKGFWYAIKRRIPKANGYQYVSTLEIFCA